MKVSFLSRLRRARWVHALQLLVFTFWVANPFPGAFSYWTDTNGDRVKEEVANPPEGDSWFDQDSDGDSLTNAQEALFGSDPYQIDADFDGLTDQIERDYTDPSAPFDPWNWDSDGDGFSDHDEFYQRLWGWWQPQVNYLNLAPGSFYSYSDADGDGTKNPDDGDFNVDRDNDGTVNWLDGAASFNGVGGMYMDDANNGVWQDPGVWIGGNWYPSGTVDSDMDGTPDHLDVYPWGSFWYNGTEYGGSWQDSDWDGVPDVADAWPYDSNNGNYYYWQDSDGDGIPDVSDSWPYDANNGGFWFNNTWYYGTATDQDNDGVPDAADSHPWDNSRWSDFDNDGRNAADDSHPEYSWLWSDWNFNWSNNDTDGDEDGIPDIRDSHPRQSWLWADWNNDGSNDAPSIDSDADNHTNENDSHPGNSSLWSDWNFNGTNNDANGDEDAREDADDSHPRDPSLWSDWNGNGSNNDSDGDEDGYADGDDSHPHYAGLHSDWNGDGDDDDSDWDEDGVANGSDSHPRHSGVSSDFDGDGRNEGDDSHPQNNQLWSDWDGNGVNNDADGDEDGWADGSDSHPHQANLWNDFDGDNVNADHDSDPQNNQLWSDWNRNGTNNDADWDEDGRANADDSAPYQPLLWSDWDQNGVNNDSDGDEDGTPDTEDSHPRDAALFFDWNYDGQNDGPQDNSDGDARDNGTDSDPLNAALWSDWNRNGTNNDADGDEDGYANDDDSHPFDPALSTDWNGDGDNNPADMDEDGHANEFNGSANQDSHPRDPNLWSDWNGNGTNNDADGDEDGVPDANDSHPFHAHLWSDWNYNQTNNDSDGDEDGTQDSQDSDPRNASLRSDWNHDGDDNDGDWDEDGHDNGNDSHPANAALWSDYDGDSRNAEDDSHPGDGSLWSDWNGNGSNNDSDGDEDGQPDYADSDPRNSTLWNDWNRNGTNDHEEWTPPPEPDRDGDGLPDNVDNWPDDPYNNADTDMDGLIDYDEVFTHGTSRDDIDSDDDFLTDYEELLVYHTNPLAQKTNPAQLMVDGYLYLGQDSDADGLPNLLEDHYSLDKNDANDANGDLDGDGVSNLQAYQNGWSLMLFLNTYDTDEDRISDAVEDYWAVRAPGSLDKHVFADAVADFDNDGVLNFEEVKLGLDLAQASTSRADGLTDMQVLAWSFWLSGGYVRSQDYAREVWQTLGNEPAPPYNRYDAIHYLLWLDSWDLNGDGKEDGLEMFRAGFAPPELYRASPTDSDGDGMPDVWEYRHQLKLRSNGDAGEANTVYIPDNQPVVISYDDFVASYAGDFNDIHLAYQAMLRSYEGDLARWWSCDPDGDTLGNLREFQLGTNPRIADTDGDGASDLAEMQAGTNPTLAGTGTGTTGGTGSGSTTSGGNTGGTSTGGNTGGGTSTGGTTTDGNTAGGSGTTSSAPPDAEAELVSRNTSAWVQDEETTSTTMKEEPFELEGNHLTEEESTLTYRQTKEAAKTITLDEPPHEVPLLWEYYVESSDPDGGASLGMVRRTHFGTEAEAQAAKDAESPTGGSAPQLVEPDLKPWRWKLKGTREVPDENGGNEPDGHTYRVRTWTTAAGDPAITHDKEEIAEMTADAPADWADGALTSPGTPLSEAQWMSRNGGPTASVSGGWEEKQINGAAVKFPVGGAVEVRLKRTDVSAEAMEQRITRTFLRVTQTVDDDPATEDDPPVVAEVTLTIEPGQKVSTTGTGPGAFNGSVVLVGRPPENKDSEMTDQLVPLNFVYHEILADGSRRPLTAPVTSLPSPTVNVSSLSVNGLMASSAQGGGLVLTASVQLAGMVDDALADVTSGANGKVQELYLLVNGTDRYAVPLQHQKNPQEGNLHKCQDYTGTFSDSIPDVRLSEGTNTLKLIARNLAGMEGYSLHSCEIQSVSLSGDSAGGSGASSAQFSAVPTAAVSESVALSVPFLGLQGNFVETSPDSAIYSQGGRLVSFQTPSAWSAQTADTVTLLFSSQDNGQPMTAMLALTETGANTLVFQSQDSDPGSGGGGVSYVIGPVTFIERSQAGEFHPMLCEFKGLPQGLAGKISAEFPVSTALYGGGGTEAEREFVNEDGALFLSGRDKTKAGIFVLTPGPDAANQEKDEPELRDASFGEGFSKGFISGGAALINDGESLITSVKDKTVQYWNLLVGEGSLRQQIKLDAQALLGTAEGALKLALAVHQFVLDRNTEAIGAVISLIAGNSQKIKELGGDYAEAFAMAAEVMDYAAEEWQQLSDGKKGYYMGRLTFEIASCFCGAAIAKVATKAQFVTKLVGRPFFQSGKGASFASKLVAFVQRLFTTKMCFVAGTPVMTHEGLKPIETIGAGEVVWSRNEVTHAEGWQPVVDTFTTHPDTLHTLRLDADGDGAADEETLTCTGEHPFWVVEQDAFVPAAELRPGWHLLRAHGSGCVTVVGVETTRAPPGQPFTTYNFEVATDHTYFVGQSGVWVHNFSERFCTKFFSITEKVQKRLGIPGDARGNRFVVLSQSFEEAFQKGYKMDSETGNFLMHVTQFEEFRDYGGDLGRIASFNHLKQLRDRAKAGGFTGGGGFEIHHSAEKWMQRALGVPESVLDDVPGIPLRGAPDSVFDQKYRAKFGKDPVYHGSNGGPDSLANRLAEIERNLRSGQITKQDMVDAVHDLYKTPPYSDLNMWPVVRDWLRQHATDATITIPN